MIQIITYLSLLCNTLPSFSNDFIVSVEVELSMTTALTTTIHNYRETAIQLCPYSY